MENDIPNLSTSQRLKDLPAQSQESEVLIVTKLAFSSLMELPILWSTAHVMLLCHREMKRGSLSVQDDSLSDRRTAADSMLLCSSWWSRRAWVVARSFKTAHYTWFISYASNLGSWQSDPMFCSWSRLFDKRRSIVLRSGFLTNRRSHLPVLMERAYSPRASRHDLIFGFLTDTINFPSCCWIHSLRLPNDLLCHQAFSVH